MIFTREVEKKFIVSGATYDELKDRIYSFTPLKDILADAKSFDLYWKAPHVDFVRLRENSKELTVKVTDKGTVTDRIEENAVIEEHSMEAVKRLTTLLFGPPSLKLTKRFLVINIKTFPAPGTEFNAVLCLYEVEEDEQKRVFLEVEAENIKIVDEVTAKLMRVLTDVDLKQESRSLYQIFVKEGEKR
jgi:hypothetical protein